jgi:hypothetical protein
LNKIACFALRRGPSCPHSMQALALAACCTRERAPHAPARIKHVCTPCYVLVARSLATARGCARLADSALIKIHCEAPPPQGPELSCPHLQQSWADLHLDHDHEACTCRSYLFINIKYKFQGTPLGLTLLAGKKKKKKQKEHHMLQYVKRVLQYVTKGKKIKKKSICRTIGPEKTLV